MVIETIKLESKRGKGNSQSSGEMYWSWEEHRERKHFAGLWTDIVRRKLEEQKGLETPVVQAVNDGY